MSSSKTTTRGRIRHVDVWSVFKISLLFFFVCGIVWLVAVIILWNMISAFGYVGQVESLAGKLAGGSFKLDSGSLLRAAVLIDVVVVFGFALTATLLAVLYNLISDVVGGISVRVDEVAERRAGGLLTRLSLPWGRNRKAPAVDGIGAGSPTARRPAAASPAKVASAGPKQPPATQPSRPPGSGAVSVKRAPTPTRSGTQPRGANNAARRPADGDTELIPKTSGDKGMDPASVAPVPPMKSPEP